MKKVFALLLVLAVSASVMFAEGVSFGAWTRTVFYAANGSSAAGSDVTQGVGPYWWGSGAGGEGMYASMGINSQGPVFGYHIGWESNGANITKGTTLNFNATVNAVPDLLSMTIGKIRNDQFRLFKDATSNPNGDRNWLIGRFDTGLTNLPGTGETAALQLVLAPKDMGLAVGIFLPVRQNASSTIAKNFENFAVAASYNIAEVGKITAGSTSKSNELGGTRNIYAGFQLTAVKGLDVLIAGQYNLDSAVSTNSSIQSNIGASFGMDALNAGVAAFIKVPLASGSAVAIGVDLDVGYNVGPVSVGLTGSVDLSTAANSNVDFMVFPYANINAIGTKIGFELKGSSAANSNINWSIPVSVDIGF